MRSNAIHRQESNLNFVKKDRWLEDDVASLPAGEHDYFERKAGALIEGDRNNLFDDLAKAASALANSGGGYLVLGMTDAGIFDGVPRIFAGRTTTRDWLEQKLPELLDYRLNDFRVHVVERSATGSTIPNDRDVIVVDIGDSALAPHQSKRHTTYFYRSAGRSVPAPHFYLELLRQRLTGADLAATLIGAQIEQGWEHEGDLFIRICLHMSIKNQGRVAAYKWALVARTLHSVPDDRKDDYFFGSTAPGAPPRNAGIRIDDTILPGCALIETVVFAVRLRSLSRSEVSVLEDASDILQGLEIAFQLATETSPGDLIQVPVGQHIDFNEVAQKLSAWIR